MPILYEKIFVFLMNSMNFLQVTQTHPLAARNRAAGEFRAIEPAGDMWSVVTESPKWSKT